jgi:hypothetical protein
VNVLETSYFDLLAEWITGTWDDIAIMDSMDQMSNQIEEKGYTFTPFESLWKLLDDLTSGIGLIMEDDEKQTELKSTLKIDEISAAARAMNLEFLQDNGVLTRILNLDDLLSSNPDWFDKISDVDRMFKDVSDSF